LVSIGLVISLGQGIIHPYYTVGSHRRGAWSASAPWACAAPATWSVASGWRQVGRDRCVELHLSAHVRLVPRAAPFVAVRARSASCHSGAAALRKVPKLAIIAVATLGFGAALAPLFSTIATARRPQGAIPSVTRAQPWFRRPGGARWSRGFRAGARRAFGAVPRRVPRLVRWCRRFPGAVAAPRHRPGAVVPGGAPTFEVRAGWSRRRSRGPFLERQHVQRGIEQALQANAASTRGRPPR